MLQLLNRNYLSLFACGLLLLLLCSAGCEKNRRQSQLRGAPDAKRAENHVEKAMNLVLADTRFKYELSDKDVANKLNIWSDSHQPATQWKPAGLLKTLDDDLRNSNVAMRIGEMRFTPTDASYIQESAWSREVVRWVVDRQAPGDFRYLIEAAIQEMDAEQKQKFARSRNLLRSSLQTMYPNLPAKVENEKAARRGKVSDLEKLTRTVQVFDWVVRYVQLQPLPPQPTADAIGEKALVRGAKTAATAGVAGPGYQRQPWHLFTACVGDSQERSRLFIRLLRELEVDAAVLALPDSENPELLSPWCVGVAMGMGDTDAGDTDARDKGTQIFLFDMQLGLPIPGPGLKGIATLKDVIADATLLSNLDLTAQESLNDIDYPFVKSQLDGGVVALVSAGEESVSKRMAELQPQLLRDQRLKLTVDADAVAERFRSVKGIKEARLWEVPFHATQFRVALESARTKGLAQIRNVAELQRESLLEMKVALISEDRNEEINFVGLSEARQRYLTGVFSAEKNARLTGAAELFSQLRVDDKDIKEFDINDMWKAEYGLNEQGSMSYVEYTRALENVKIQLRFIGADATYYLSQTHYDHRQTSNALAWFETYEKRALTGAAAWQQWQPSAVYMQGRCHESLREFDQAIERYTNDNRSSDPQYFGNVIRARLLKKWAVKKK